MNRDEQDRLDEEIPGSPPPQEFACPQSEDVNKVPDAADAEGREQAEVRAGSKRPSGPIVAIGASAGGLEALQEFFSNIQPDTGIAFVVITHVRPGRESLLPELIGATTEMEVIHAEDSTRIKPNKVIVARDSLLNIQDGALRPIKGDGTTTETYHPVDHFFRALADDQREHAIGIILSGSGQRRRARGQGDQGGRRDDHGPVPRDGQVYRHARQRDCHPPGRLRAITARTAGGAGGVLPRAVPAPGPPRRRARPAG
jgi:chemotaxis response regulator CheB